jgi:hypothetical protein
MAKQLYPEVVMAETVDTKKQAKARDAAMTLMRLGLRKTNREVQFL